MANEYYVYDVCLKLKFIGGKLALNLPKGNRFIPAPYAILIENTKYTDGFVVKLDNFLLFLVCFVISGSMFLVSALLFHTYTTYIKYITFRRQVGVIR